MTVPDVDRVLRRFLAAAASDAALIEAIGALAPAPVEAWRQTAAGMIRADRPRAALSLLDAALQRFPRDVELRYWRGNALRLNGLVEQAESVYREVLGEDPCHRDAALALAFLLREQGRIVAASAVVSASTRSRAADAAESQANLGFLRECGAFAAAHELAQEARARFPDDAGIAALAGEFALAVGAFDRARDALRAALAREPQRAPCWLRLAYCGRFERADEPDVRRFEDAWRDTARDAPTRACIGFALGKALDDLGDYARAASVLREANALARATLPWDADRWHWFVAQRLAAPALPPRAPVADFTPVFVVGLPRTGTTLAATLLARRFDVRDRGELNWIGAMHDHLAAHGQLHDARAIAAAAAVVEAQMRRDDAPARFHLDKNPLNFRYLDLIAAMFPQARVIHCRRGARDTALSLWMQYFAHDDMAFAYDFGTIAEFAAGYQRLMAHWRATLALPILDLDYEALVAEPEDAVHRLGAFLGATPSAASAPTGAIATASVWQARQPVYTSSIGRWRHYAPHLPELTQRFAE